MTSASPGELSHRIGWMLGYKAPRYNNPHCSTEHCTSDSQRRKVVSRLCNKRVSVPPEKDQMRVNVMKTASDYCILSNYSLA